MPALLADRAALWTPLGADAEWDARLMRWLNAVRARARAGVTAPHRLHDLHAALDEMRLVKDAHELALMRRAAAISAAAHRRAMRAPGRRERVRDRGRAAARVPPPGRAGSRLLADRRRRRQRLHSPLRAERRQLRDGDLLLIDAGCELEGYAADITRTFPVNGRFSGAQRDVYEMVLAAQRAAMDKVRARQRLERAARRRGARARAGHARPQAARTGASTKCWRRKPTSASTCIAPATGWAWTCTTPASTSARAPGAG
jgi:Xaa-Pro aminopeptidase